MLIPPPIEPATLALFAGFSMSVTQLVKQEYVDIKRTLLYLISSGSFVLSALVFVLLPLEWQTFYLMMLGGITIPGAVGLVKDIRRDDGHSAVTVTQAEEVTAEHGSTITITPPVPPIN